MAKMEKRIKDELCQGLSKNYEVIDGLNFEKLLSRIERFFS